MTAGAPRGKALAPGGAAPAAVELPPEKEQPLLLLVAGEQGRSVTHSVPERAASQLPAASPACCRSRAAAGASLPQSSLTLDPRTAAAAAPASHSAR